MKINVVDEKKKKKKKKQNKTKILDNGWVVTSVVVYVPEGGL